MDRQELKEVLSTCLKQLYETDQTQKINELESMIRYLKNEVEQLNIKNMKLQSRALEVVKIMEGYRD